MLGNMEIFHLFVGGARTCVDFGICREPWHQSSDDMEEQLYMKYTH
jgi:hypothetical protein